MDTIMSKAFQKETEEQKELEEIENMLLEIKPVERVLPKITEERVLPNPIIEIYKQKYNPEELTDDGIPTIETQLKELKVIDEELENKRKENELKIYNREMVQRVKCLSLQKMGLSIMVNTNDLSTRERQKLQKLMWEYNDIEHTTIIKEFNEEFGNMLDDIKTIDYSKLPVYDF